MNFRIAVAPDSFKGTLTSAEAAAAIVAGLLLQKWQKWYQNRFVV